VAITTAAVPTALLSATPAPVLGFADQVSAPADTMVPLAVPGSGSWGAREDEALWGDEAQGVTPYQPFAPVWDRLPLSHPTCDLCCADGSWAAESENFAPAVDPATAVAAFAFAGGLSWRTDGEKTDPRRRRFLA